MKTTTLLKIVLVGTILFWGILAKSQVSETLYKGKSITANVVHVKFKDDPMVIQKLESTFSSSGRPTGLLKSSAQKELKKVEGLTKLNSLNKAYSAVEMFRLFRHAGKFEEKHREFGLHLWYEIKFQNGVDIKQVIDSYSEIDYAQLVTPSYAVKQNAALSNTANDPGLGKQWHYENYGLNEGTVDADIDLEQAWTIEAGNSGVVVAIEDGGIDINHEDLAGNIWVNPGEIAGNGIDDDNNGYIDDVNGYNFCDNTGTIVAVSHGTHVAGTIGAETNNGIGVAGIAGGTGNNDGVRLMSCQVFTESSAGGFEEALVYAADNGAVISQNSWGYTDPGIYDQSVLDAIDYFIANAGGPNAAMDGGIVVFAAGNDSTNGERYPAYYSSTLAVASVNNQDELASYSNYGTWVDISAPGGEIDTSGETGVLSTFPDNKYGYYHGTSMACPHVSGVAALVVSHNYGNITASELRTILLDNVDDISGLNPGFSGQMGSGRLNAYLALSANVQETVPEMASNPTPEDGATSVSLSSSLSWTAGSWASSHNVYFGTSNPPMYRGNQESTIYSPSSLDPNTTYYWRVDEVNSAGTTTGAVWSFTTSDVSSREYASLPYSTGFESGSVDGYWLLETENSYGRLQVSASNSPRGNYHLVSDVSIDGNFSTNGAWLNVDLSGKEQVDLSFYWKEFDDEDHTEDGVYISDDAGNSFTKIYDLTGGSSTYQQINIDLDEKALANGLSLTSTFVIKFQHRDNYSLSSDGFAFDDISVTEGSETITYPVNLVLVFDNYPEETSWEIVNSNGTTIESGGTYDSEPDGSNKTISINLPLGCFDFTIYDLMGDGMCCNYGYGSYELTLGTTLITYGDIFGSSETTSFCLVETLEYGLEAQGISDVVEGHEDLDLEIYPNPVVNFMVIKIQVADQSEYSIRDVTGKALFKGNLDGHETYVDLSSLSAGFYFIELEIDGKKYAKKIVKN